MPDAMETSHTDWVGRKHAKLKRSTLDCGHANPGDVHYHYWCDRLSCSEECANAGHDCSQFKGSKSGSEGEAVEPEAVVEEPGLPAEAELNEAAVEMNEARFREAFAEIAADREAVEAVIAEAFATGGIVTRAPILGVTTAGDNPWADIEETYRQFAGDPQADTRRFYLNRQTSTRMCESCMDLPAASGFRACRRCLRATGEANSATLVAPLVDEPVELDPGLHRYECPHPDCGWVKIARFHPHLLDLAEAHELEQHPARPWWRPRWWR